MAEATFTDLESISNNTLFILIPFAFYLFTFTLSYRFRFNHSVVSACVVVEVAFVDA